MSSSSFTPAPSSHPPLLRSLLDRSLSTNQNTFADLFGMHPLSLDRKKEIYIKLVSDHQAWKAKADDLLHAASFLKPEVELIYRKLGPKGLNSKDRCNRELHRNCTADVYFMLMGYAIENILKGILVRGVTRGKRHSLIPKPKLPKALKCHDVKSLSIAAGFKLNSLEEELFERITEIVVWRGRYQAPTKVSDFKGYHRRDCDLGVLDGLLEKISRKEMS